MPDIGRLRDGISRGYKAIAILTLNALVIVGGLELISRATVDVWTTLSSGGEKPADARSRSSYYASKSWARQYWKEFALARRQRYHAFTVWRRAAFKGEMINIDSRGVRVTPGSECGPGAFRVFTFGSSHMWGTGAPDWGTIPAYLLADLKNYRQGPICVTNFGESGYMTTQSVIELVLQLQSGNVPNVALFLDGASDIYTGYQSGRSGDVHENFDRTAATVERRDASPWPLAIQTLEDTSLFRLVNSQMAKLSTAPPAENVVTYETMKIDPISLANAITGTYLSNYQTVDALARRYGFEYYFFWPPHLSKGKKALTGEEEVLKRAMDPALQRLFDAVYETTEKHVNREYKNLFSITDVFDQCKSLIWLDDGHTTPVGNQIIAARMLRIISERESPDASSDCDPDRGSLDEHDAGVVRRATGN
jgi:lysophospholipase L1-like esterase